MQPRGDASWAQTYEGEDPRRMPWFTERLDADLAAWVDALKLPSGAAALDLGTGPGTAALHLARQGFRVTALDMSPDAVAFAKQRAGPLAKDVAWLVGDVFRLEPGGPFDLALDRGLFHVFPDELRGPYAERVAGWLKPRGRLLLKTFSELEPAGYGPRRVTRAEVRQVFGRHFEEEGWQPSTFPGQLGHEPKAHLFVLRKR
jgi:SAM-dependent methyltransferase